MKSEIIAAFLFAYTIEYTRIILGVFLAIKETEQLFGQIQSKKALRILYGFYKNDPEGKTCRDHHNSVLCQYEIYKAIKCIEHDYWWVSRPGLNK